ncbi:MAG: response regulator [Syntrophales bacterium]
MEKAINSLGHIETGAKTATRILVVEDDEGLNHLAQKALRRAGYETDGVMTGAEAIERLMADPHMTLLLDERLPDMHGTQIIHTLIERNRHVPFVAMTGYGNEKIAVEMMKLGARDYLIKGFDLTDLLPEVFHRVFHDLETEKHLAVAAQDLREREEKYTRLFNCGNDAIFVHPVRNGIPGKFIDVNDVACARLGYGRDELLRMSFTDIDAEGGMDDDRRRAMETMAETGQCVFEMVHIGKSGNKIPVEISSRVFDIEEKSYAISIARDITERKRAEKASRESETRLRSILESVQTGIVIIDPETHTIVDVNAVAAEMIGDPKERIIGSVCHNYICPAEKDKCPVTDLGNKIENSERGLLSTDGTTIPIIKTVVPITLGGKKHLLESFVNITDRKRTEEERERLQAQLLQAQKMESVGRLAGGVAHDFNNMLGVILGHVDLVMDETDPSQPLYGNLQEIRKAAERSAELTQQLLAFARKQIISPKVIDLNDTVEGMLKMLRRLIGEDIDLAWLPGAGLSPVKADPSQIHQVLANLCVNARDAIAGMGKVTIETDDVAFDAEYCADNPGLSPGAYVLLAVSDDGCGMDKETLNRLFEPFFTTKEMGQGTGLGLAMVYGIVKQNQGFINVYSEPGKGTTFKIYLPRHRGQTEQPQPEGPVKQAPRGQETILVVEDEPEMLEVITMLLRRQGYTVLAASTPGEAIRQAGEYKGEIDLLMTDVVMPEMNGRDLASHLLSLHPKLKRLFMSGYTANVIAHHGVLEEGMHFIQKPFSTMDLAVKVRQVLRDCQ